MMTTVANDDTQTLSADWTFPSVDKSPHSSSVDYTFPPVEKSLRPQPDLEFALETESPSTSDDDSDPWSALWEETRPAKWEKSISLRLCGVDLPSTWQKDGVEEEALVDELDSGVDQLAPKPPSVEEEWEEEEWWEEEEGNWEAWDDKLQNSLVRKSKTRNSQWSRALNVKIRGSLEALEFVPLTKSQKAQKRAKKKPKKDGKKVNKGPVSKLYSKEDSEVIQLYQRNPQAKWGALKGDAKKKKKKTEITITATGKKKTKKTKKKKTKRKKRQDKTDSHAAANVDRDLLQKTVQRKFLKKRWLPRLLKKQKKSLAQKIGQPLLSIYLARLVLPPIDPAEQDKLTGRVSCIDTRPTVELEMKRRFKTLPAFEVFRHHMVTKSDKLAGFSVSQAPISRDVQVRFMRKLHTGEGKEIMDRCEFDRHNHQCKTKLSFHGTRQTVVPAIMTRGLLVPGSGRWRPAVRNGSAYGVGIYTSTTSSFAMSYTDSGQLLVCATIMKDTSEFNNILVSFQDACVIPLLLAHSS